MQYFPFCSSYVEGCSYTPALFIVSILAVAYSIYLTLEIRKVTLHKQNASNVRDFQPGKCLNCGEKAQDHNLFCVSCDPNMTNFKSDPQLSVGVASFLPPALEENTVRHIEEGRVYYTVPWAMFADPNRQLFIVGTYSISEEERGTCHLRVKKMKGQIYVDSSSIRDHKYNPGTPCYMGVGEDEYIPVCLVDSF